MASRPAWVRCGVERVELLGDVGLGRQGEHQVFERSVQSRVAQHGAQGLQQGSIQHLRGFAVCFDGGQGRIQAQALRGFPLVERVGVVRQEGEQLSWCDVMRHHHGCTETTQARWHGHFVGV